VVRLLLGPFTEVPIDRPIAEEAGRLRRQTGIHVADALIAASARLNDLVLTTRNLRHFERVPGLTVRSPG
jgi:predicted nucleic acid-binding protein